MDKERRHQIEAKYRETHREQIRARNRERQRQRRAEAKARNSLEDQEQRTRDAARSRAYYAAHREERKAYVGQWQKDNPEKFAEYQRRARARNPEPSRARARRYKRAHADEIRAYMAAYMREYQYRRKDKERYPVAWAARRAVQDAVRKGWLLKPDCCEGCGNPTPRRKLHGHHHRGYDHPVDVQWLCSICHGKAHRTDEE